MSVPLSRPMRAGFGCAILLAAILFGNRAPVAAGDYLIDTWRFDDDLPRDGINSIAQGSDGYLWISSRYGFARFDGRRFIQPEPNMMSLFPGHHYANLSSDARGTVWIGTPGGGLLHWRDQQLITCIVAGNPVFGPSYAGLTNAQGRDLALTPEGRVMGWSNGVSQLVAQADAWGNPIENGICQNRDGSIWFVTYQRKLVRVMGTNCEELIFGSGENRRNWIALETDAAGELWAGTQREVGIWRDGKFKPIPAPVEPFPIEALVTAHPMPNAAASPSQCGMWVIALGQAWLVKGERWITNVPFESQAGLYEISPRLVDREGNLWFTGTKASLARAGVDGSLVLIGTEDGLPPGKVSVLKEDREGGLWVGIEHAGLSRLRPRYFQILGARENNRAPLVWAVAEDRAGAIWMGTENAGLQRWQSGKLTPFNLGNSGLAGSIYSLLVDGTGTVWAGTGDSGVFRYDNGKFVPVWEYSEPGWNKRVYVIYEDRYGQHWFGTGLGLFRRDAAGKIRRFNGKGFELGVVRAMTEDRAGRLWLGMSGGSDMRLARLEGEEFIAEGIREGLAGRDVFGLYSDSKGRLWIGTAGDGLWCRQDGAFHHYALSAGLPDERIFAITEDRLGNLWLGSPAGIIRIELSRMQASTEPPTTLPALVFDRTDGLPTRECSGGSQPSIFRMNDGRLLFAMSEGAVALSSERVIVNRFSPPVLIEQIRVDGKVTAMLAAAGQAQQVELGPGRHTLEFQYTATSLLAGSKVRFKYRLEPVDSGWSQPEPLRSAMYNLTSPGEYRFHVTACNNDGVWNPTGAVIGLNVPPYVWQTWWFRLAAGAAILLVIGAGVRANERRKMRRQVEALEMQRTMERERSRIARDIHDELGASLTEIGLLSEFAQHEGTPADQVKADVAKIASKARSGTLALDEIVWAVNPRNDTIEGFVNYACAYAEEHLRLADIRCRLDLASDLPRTPLRADLRHHLFLGFKEALNNLVKHSRASEATLSIQADAQHLRVELKDNGCGFDYAARAGRGNGLINMKERLESIGGNFECITAPGAGTQVKLTLTLELKNVLPRLHR